MGNDNLGWQTIERQQPKANQNHMFHVFTHMFHCLNIHLKSMLGNTARWLEANSSWQLLSRSRTMWNLQRPRKLQRREASKNKLQRSHQHYPPTPAEGGGAREGLQVREPCASSSQHEPAGNRRFHCSMLLEHMHHWSRNLLRFFVAARTCRQQTLPLLHAARTHASVEPQATATYEPLWRWLTMSRSCSLRPSPSRKQGWAPKV